MEAAKALYGIEKGAKVADVLEVPRGLQREDQALLRELVYGCVRQKRLLDHLLASRCKTPYAKLPVEVRISLRLGLYQLLFLDRIPPHAAVHESVELAKKGGQAALSGFVNAVLRNAEPLKDALEVQGDGPQDTLALRHSHPTWLVKRWAETLDPESLERVLKADNKAHATYLRTRPMAGPNVTEDLKRQGVEIVPEAWPPDTYRVQGPGGGMFGSESFQKGDWIVQDWVPQAMLELLPVKEGQKVWDVCAAPGGKSVGLAWRVGEKGQVVAGDIAPGRLEKLAENLKRTGLKQVTVLAGGIEKMHPSQKFDLIWVDAPCSGTGVLSRRADLRWKLAPQEIASQAVRQKELLKGVERYLYPGGLLVYSTCSLEKEENQEVVAAFLEANPGYEATSPTLPTSRSGVARGRLGITFWPTEDHDGGFLAVLQKP